MADIELHNPSPAGLARRLMACLYDWLLVLALLMVASVPLVAITDNAVDPGNNFYRLALVIMIAAFFIGFWRYGGQTPGMKAWRLRVTEADGSGVSWSQAVLRFLFATVALLPVGLGFFWSAINSEKLAWHDRWSDTRLRVYPKNPGKKD